jgi:hypothetical protein
MHAQSLAMFFTCLLLGDACGAKAMNHQLLAVNCCTRGGRNPGKGLLRQAGHLSAFRTEEVDVVAGTFAGRFVFVPAKPPSSIRALNSVKKARYLQSLEGPVNRHPVE